MVLNRYYRDGGIIPLGRLHQGTVSTVKGAAILTSLISNCTCIEIIQSSVPIGDYRLQRRHGRIERISHKPFNAQNYAALLAGAAAGSPARPLGTNPFAFFAVQSSLASPPVSDDDPGADCPSAAAAVSKVFNLQITQRTQMGCDRAATERRIQFADAGRRTLCFVPVKRQRSGVEQSCGYPKDCFRHQHKST